MSVYVIAFGTLHFSSKEGLNSAVAILRDGGWLDDQGRLRDEAGGLHNFSGEEDVDGKQLKIDFPFSSYRNLSHVLSRVCEKACSGEVRVGSNDGDFWLARYLAGGIVEDMSIQKLISEGLIEPYKVDDPLAKDLDWSDDDDVDLYNCWTEDAISSFVGGN